MKWYTYVICAVMIVVGTFCGIQLYKEVKAESYVNGSINVENKFSQESFTYSASSVVFSLDSYAQTPETYVFENNLLKVDDFNAETKTYQIKLNKYILLDADIRAGSIFANVHMDFYGTDGQLVQGADMQMSILFLDDRTQLRFIVIGQESKAFIEKYFANNGIRLRVYEIVEKGVK